MAQTLQTQEEPRKHLTELVATCSPPLAGALFTFVFGRLGAGAGLEYLAGKLKFSPVPLIARRPADYAHLRLVEEWIQPADAAVERVFQISLGSGAVDGVPIGVTFPHASAADREPVAPKLEWPVWQYRLSPNPQSSSRERSWIAYQQRAVAEGLEPHQTGAAAALKWIVGAAPHGTAGPDDQLWVIVPDLRVRLSRVTWRDTRLSFCVERNTNAAIEVQTLFFGNREATPFTSKRLGAAKECRLSVPEDASSACIMLVQGTELLLQHVVGYEDHLFSPARLKGGKPAELAREEIQGGERETVEFKPFMDSRADANGKPKGKDKLDEVIKTAIAFSNTEGGRIYVGVTDDGAPQGQAKLCEQGATDWKDAIKRARSQLDKALRDNIRPVPELEIRDVDIVGAPVIVVDIKKGKQPPYSDARSNLVFIRKGATNRVPDPQTEMPGLMRAVSPGGLDLVSQLVSCGQVGLIRG